MIEKDTTRLLRECELGTRMGIKSIVNTIDSVDSDSMRKRMLESKEEHEAIREELEAILKESSERAKEAPPMVEGVSYIKTKLGLALNSFGRSYSRNYD